MTFIIITYPWTSTLKKVQGGGPQVYGNTCCLLPVA